MDDKHWVREAKKLVADPATAKRVVELFTPSTEPVLASGSDVAHRFRAIIGSPDVERLALILVDRRLRLIASDVVSEGSDGFTIVCPKRIIRWALTQTKSPYGLFMGHNHPSGDPQPSSEDDRVTDRVVEACRAVGIVFLDHLVLGDGIDFASYSAMGKIQRAPYPVSYTREA